MNNLPAILILDDDPVMLNLLALRLNKRFPDLRVETQQEPMAIGTYDIYILDNDFQGRPLAADLAEQIKRQQPDSLVLALSGTLCATTLKRLLNCGCDGAFDKSIPSDVDLLIATISEHVNNPNQSSIKKREPQARVVETARAIAGLIQDWNRRLELEETRGQVGIVDKSSRTISENLLP
jgi:DNA-binding NarL/FixJ family response regulator